MTKKEESIRSGVQSLKSKIMTSAGEEFLSWPKEKQNQFIERGVLEIAKDEKLAPCFESTEGKLSIIKAFESMVSTCLIIGGKHAYLVPQNRKSKRKDEKGKEIWITEIRFSIKDVGYYALLCGGKRPIFKDLRWNQVYKNESSNVIIDSGTGEVKHPEFLGEDKGVLIGCWVQCIKMNGQKEAKFYPMKKINEWRDNSDAFQYALKNNYKDTPWLSWPDEMAVESCIRHFCDKYEKARELLASAIYDEDYKDEPEKSPIEKIEAALTEPDKQPLPVDKNTTETLNQVEKNALPGIKETVQDNLFEAGENEKDLLDIF
jgi:recombinational DNA repair protein RecT